MLRVLSFGAVTGDDLVMAGPLDEVFEFLQVKLSIRVGKENIIVTRGENPAFEGGPITTVINVVDGPDFLVLLGEFITKR